MAFAAKLNSVKNLTSYLKAADLKVKQKYEVLAFEETDGNYGRAVLAELKNFGKIYLPKAHQKLLLQSAILEEFDQIKAKGHKLYIVSHGPIGSNGFNSTDLRFIEESADIKNEI